MLKRPENFKPIKRETVRAAKKPKSVKKVVVFKVGDRVEGKTVTERGEINKIGLITESLLEKIDKNAFFIKDETDNRDYFFYANELKMRKIK